VYNRSTRVQIEKKREVLDAWAVELRRIIGGRAAVKKKALLLDGQLPSALPAPSGGGFVFKACQAGR
jgi:hypothetical protein